MTVRNLNYVFEPKSVAVIGASNQPHSVGQTVMRNLLQSGFAGPVMPVNPRWDTVAGVLGYPSVEALPRTAELAVICTPAPTVPAIISQLGQRGTKAAIILTAGFDVLSRQSGIDYMKATLEASRPHLLRLIGPNCVGVLAPHSGLNASFAHLPAIPGRLAFVSQSGALATTVLDWANGRGIGFSHFISTGNAWDVDFGDLLDYLGGDAKTHAILLYVESITSARKFMSAARAAARNKPVIVIKAGRFAAGAAAAATHTGALAGADDIYDAAIRRAGMLRVDEIEDLFNTAELLGRDLSIKGDRLAIMTNGGGAGVMAADALASYGSGRLATLSERTLSRLDAVLPAGWSHANPVDIIGDAPIERYLDALAALEDAGECDAVLLLQAPTAIVPGTDVAKAVCEKLSDYRHPVLTCWLGGETAQRARNIVTGNGFPAFATPEDAISAFSRLNSYRRNQALLMETPVSVPMADRPDREQARSIVRKSLADGRSLLSEPEAKAVLSSYAIPVVETRIAADTDEACRLGSELGYPIALKIFSPDISHKSDVGGVILDIENERQLRDAATAMLARVRKLRPEARLDGFTVQNMARRPGSFELILGSKLDPVFGPVIIFGAGGTGVEIIADHAVALPPLNMSLARHLVEETAIARLLRGYRNRKSVDLESLYATIVKLAQLVADIPEITGMDINPLLADEHGVLALDARITTALCDVNGLARLAIRPYPNELEETIECDGEPVLIRPIRPEDEHQHRAFLESTDPEDLQFRFFALIRHFEHSQLARLTQIDYDREMAFVAETGEGIARRTIGVVRLIVDPDNIEGEFAIIVHADYKSRGLGTLLMNKVIAYARQRGTRMMVGQVRLDNAPMLTLAGELGFERQTGGEPGSVRIVLAL